MNKFSLLIFFIIASINIFGQIDIIEANETYIDKHQKILELEKVLIQEPLNYDVIVELAVIYHNLYMQNDLDFLDRSKELFQLAKKIDNTNPEVNLRFGSILLLSSRNTWFLPAKLWYSFTGSSDMNRVIEDHKNNLSFRFIRGYSCYIMKEFDFCLKTAIEDFVFIIDNYNEKYDYKCNFSIIEIKYYLAVLYYENRNYTKSKIYAETIINEYPESLYKKLAQDILFKIENRR